MQTALDPKNVYNFGKMTSSQVSKNHRELHIIPAWCVYVNLFG